MTLEELQDYLRKKLRTAYNLGQTYWQQADSEYRRDHKKSAETANKFIELIEHVVAAVTFEMNRAAAQDSAPAELHDGWLIDGSLVYKLDPTGSMNAFEINVTMADGSRKPEGPRVDLAKKILAWLAAAPASPQPVAKVLTAWEYFFIHEGTTAAAPMEIGPCITYDKEQAFGIGCIKQREVSILAASTPTTLTEKKE
jgi:hypothetical protein